MWEAYIDLLFILGKINSGGIYRGDSMSVSSVGSQSSVGFHGGLVHLDQALDETVRDLIGHLNKVQLALRQISVASEQDMKYEDELSLAGGMDDDLREMSWLFDDLRGMQMDLISQPDTPEEKLMLKKWKLDRKALEKKLQGEHDAKFKAEREQSKLALKAEKLRIAEEGEE